MEFTVNLNVNVRFPDLPAIITDPGAGAKVLQCLSALFAAYPLAKTGCMPTADSCHCGCDKAECEKKQKENESSAETPSIKEIMKTCSKLIETGKREQITAILKELNTPPIPLANLPPNQLEVFAERIKQLERVRVEE